MPWQAPAFVKQRFSCRSEHAREEPEDDTGIQTSRVIVDVHREQARSYKKATDL
jgi:hypothetical protein